MKAGVLALQGCVEPHLKIFEALGVAALPVKWAHDLNEITHLVIPGGESTTMLKIIEREGLWEPLLTFSKRRPVWGVCAGAILIAQEVANPSQRSLGLIDIKATRNYYGSQVDSFKADVEIKPLNLKAEVDFIRAPLLSPLSGEIEVFANFRDSPVFLKQRNIIATSFHIELNNELGLHRFFLTLS